MECPRCGAAMQEQRLDGHHGQPVVIDLCHSCQAIWFDQYESVKLTPGATLSLFRIIGEQIGRPAASRADLAKCPRCHVHLRRTHDMQHATRFEYLRCPHDHGRFTSFFDFLREKNFIRPLTAEQIDELRRNIQIVNCSNCGGPIDLARGSACGHCGSPVSMLDMQQAAALVTQLQSAEERGKHGIDPLLPLEMTRARREVEQAFARLDGDPHWWRDAADTGLVAAGLSALARWLKT